MRHSHIKGEALISVAEWAGQSESWFSGVLRDSLMTCSLNLTSHVFRESKITGMKAAHHREAKQIKLMGPC